MLKTSDNYKTLNANMAQQILKEVDGSFKSFFGLLKLARKGKYAFKNKKIHNKKGMNNKHDRFTKKDCYDCKCCSDWY